MVVNYCATMEEYSSATQPPTLLIIGCGQVMIIIMSFYIKSSSNFDQIKFLLR